MIRVALSIAWREVRLVAYRHAALNSLCPFPDDTPLSAERRAEVAIETERLARAMLDAEGTR